MSALVRRRPRTGRRPRLGAAALAAAFLVPAASAQAVTPPTSDPFYRYTGTTPLSEIAPGTVLNTRIRAYRLAGIPLPLAAVQLAYRTTSQTGKPTVNVTSVIKPPFKNGPTRVLSYQSAYDSLNPNDEPSYAVSGGVTLGGLFNTGEATITTSWLLAGATVVLTDTEGQTANFAAGPEYGRNTLDALRAAYASRSVGLPATAPTALLGYSGGAIATEWAAELAPTYAPDVNSKLVGAAFGGVLVSPAHNLHYVNGSKIWAGVIPMAIIGAARSFDIDLQPYLSDYGKQIYAKLKNASIIQVLGAYPGLTWQQMAKPEFAVPESVPVYVNAVNQLIMGTGGTPTIPMFIGQGNRGDYEGTANNQPGIGAGDGVMIAGDVRSLARQYCAQGTQVLYREYASSHVGTLTSWLSSATAYLQQRLAGKPATNNCAQIAPGNSLAPIPQS